MNVAALLESILFVSQKPLTAQKLAAVCGRQLKEVREALDELSESYQSSDRGIVLLQNAGEYQLASHPSSSDVVQVYLQEESIGELTRPALETLSVIAYRGPVAKSEIEKIRGVNCSLALRNLMIRGLIDEEHMKDIDEKSYRLSFQFLRHLGVSETSELPDYARLHSDDIIAGLTPPHE